MSLSELISSPTISSPNNNQLMSEVGSMATMEDDHFENYFFSDLSFQKKCLKYIWYCLNNSNIDDHTLAVVANLYHQLLYQFGGTLPSANLFIPVLRFDSKCQVYCELHHNPPNLPIGTPNLSLIHNVDGEIFLYSSSIYKKLSHLNEVDQKKLFLLSSLSTAQYKSNFLNQNNYPDYSDNSSFENILKKKISLERQQSSLNDGLGIMNEFQKNETINLPKNHDHNYSGKLFFYEF